MKSNAPLPPQMNGDTFTTEGREFVVAEGALHETPSSATPPLPRPTREDLIRSGALHLRCRFCDGNPYEVLPLFCIKADCGHDHEFEETTAPKVKPSPPAGYGSSPALTFDIAAAEDYGAEYVAWDAAVRRCIPDAEQAILLVQR